MSSMKKLPQSLSAREGVMEASAQTEVSLEPTKPGLSGKEGSQDAQEVTAVDFPSVAMMKLSGPATTAKV